MLLFQRRYSGGMIYHHCGQKTVRKRLQANHTVRYKFSTWPKNIPSRTECGRGTEASAQVGNLRDV